ncbi:substrate-binding domain-containing protein [Pseudorhodoferax sp.]|uniref:substrate-binding domain-containing protein n=1 Tax=Pseudorhodoferax sp. TaxID=1993553 RepID=UPI0039E6DCEC
MVAAIALTAAALTAAANEPVTINVYGPGGPAPAMQEAAQAYGAASGVRVEVVAGPTPQWVEKAKADADVVFSGAENMMSDFAKALPGAFDLREAEPLYLRPVAILVRPGNPKGIQGFHDLLKPGIKILAVAGAGQTGLWEDVAGRTGDIDIVKAFRRNLVLPEAANSALARRQWTERPEIDAWLIWNIWQVANPGLAQVVPVEEPYRIYRDAGVVLTAKGKNVEAARGFVAYLKSEEGRRVFAKWGWHTQPGTR